MAENINTKEYWDRRFGAGDWERRHGRWQTTSFAEAQVPLLGLARDFEGTLLDFGCGLGDAIPVYRRAYPRATLIGMDISAEAIRKCEERYEATATFLQGDHSVVPNVDVIVASNVFEHLSMDKDVAATLVKRCRHLYIVVPYKEWPLCDEHINTYDETSFDYLNVVGRQIFRSRGWTEYGLSLLVNIYLRNIGRRLLGKAPRKRAMQIMFHIVRPDSDTPNAWHVPSHGDPKASGMRGVPG